MNSRAGTYGMKVLRAQIWMLSDEQFTSCWENIYLLFKKKSHVKLWGNFISINVLTEECWNNSWQMPYAIKHNLKSKAAPTTWPDPPTDQQSQIPGRHHQKLTIIHGMPPWNNHKESQKHCVFLAKEFINLPEEHQSHLLYVSGVATAWVCSIHLGSSYQD